MPAEESELTIACFINAPPAVVWKAWSTPEHLAKWWIPAPIECKVIKLDLRPGGGFETRMREGDGEFRPHVEGCFLEIVPEALLVFTTVLTEGWQPAEPWLALTAIMTLEAEGSGTRYSAASCTKTLRTLESMKKWGFTMAGGPRSTNSR